jgi:light-regulated signal transduction histidine kinase (bacteriophytochrome)
MADDQEMGEDGTGREEEEALHLRVAELSYQLELVKEDLEALNYSVSHDLRAPLRSIEGFSQVLLEEYDSVLDSTGQDYLRRVALGARRMNDMIDGLLTLSRLGRSEMHRERVNLAGMARAVVARLRSMHQDREVTIDIPEEVWAEGDRDLLRVVVENLLDNAWKFTSGRPQARIELGARAQNGVTVYFVRDDGAGFDMTYTERLFAPFHRMHRPTEFEGKGMGLALVRRAVHRHGGRVWAEAAVDRGASFYFTLQAGGGTE